MTPDFYWDREDLGSLYESMCSYMEVRRRTKVRTSFMHQEQLCCVAGFDFKVFGNLSKATVTVIHENIDRSFFTILSFVPNVPKATVNDTDENIAS